ncbi:DUF3597 domain-containing protein [Paraburkholderia sp. LEh10]|jgi:hypothetical protein|uniref:DUF3597 domain-containing protein n=1 Tax=Paraburkholderia sp. LEh10 TaxID=2821353 RepID=UPI001AE4A8D7|nr:DUF3597 domain-containing protein [Paraburkholderia sp. LEh10]MBP0588281.1 DUF3597 domain-containing protein [Paraburkholderia sp. LEh10]
MSIFGNIMNTIFGHHASGAAAASQAPGATTAPAGQQASPAGTPPATASSGAGATTSTAASIPAQPAVQPAAPRQEVDVEAVLTRMQANHGEQLNWRTSIVDLLKLLGLDSSLAARKELASELHYSGSTDDSAAMNIWLHKQVIQKLAENGGKVPDDLKN